MNHDQSVTRRALLGSGSALGLSAVSGAAFALPALPSPLGARPAKGAKIVFDYKPSQVTGWSPPYSPTQGGHRGVSDFSWKGKSYRVSLLSFGQPGSAPHPIYTAMPSDTRVNFKRTLAGKWGKYYTFRYLGGLPSGAYFTVESYGAFHGRPANPLVRNPGVIVGADLYAVYHPGGQSSHPAVNSDLQFIQVVDYQIAPSPPDSRDDTDRANPFYGEGGGLTSINGTQSISFSDFVREGFSGTVLPANFFVAETFLAQDTRTKDRTGRDIVNIFGGIRWGWQLRNLG
jgi:hypothetical protein